MDPDEEQSKPKETDGDQAVEELAGTLDKVLGDMLRHMD